MAKSTEADWNALRRCLRDAGLAPLIKHVAIAVARRAREMPREGFDDDAEESLTRLGREVAAALLQSKHARYEHQQTKEVQDLYNQQEALDAKKDRQVDDLGEINPAIRERDVGGVGGLASTPEVSGGSAD